MFWRKVDKGDHSGAWRAHLADLDAVLAKRREREGIGAPWRMNQAGDLPGLADWIDAERLAEVVALNARHAAGGFTYTHKPVRALDVKSATPSAARLAAANRRAVAAANAQGFTINLSANDLDHADALADLGVAPVVVLLPADAPEKTTTPQGRRVVVCPAQTREGVTCATCRLCSRSARSVVVGFRAHGAGSRQVAEVARANSSPK
jgi:hypothetical protein